MSLGELWRRWQFWRYRQRLTEELEEEMRLHIALRAQQLSQQGWDGGEAASIAQRRFGNRTLLKEVSRDMWGWISLERFLQGVSRAF